MDPSVSPAASGVATAATTVMVVITAISAIGTSILAYLSGKDKLRFDADMVALRKDVADCQNERAELKVQMERIEERANRENKELREEIRDLRNRLYGQPK